MTGLRIREPRGARDEKGIFHRYPGSVGLALLTCVYVLSFVDRKLPFILIEAIKSDLDLSDTQIGLMTGVAFTLIYAVAGIPLSIAANRFGRRRIIGCCVILWSMLTAAGGLATNFWQLALARTGVAIGEAGVVPSAHALIGAYFPEARAKALAIFSMGAPIGVLIGLALGGWINDLANWRVAMLVLGLPGIPVAIAVFLLLREPPSDCSKRPSERRSTALGDLFGCSTFRHLVAAGALFGCASGATMTFTPAFAMRSFGLSATQVGVPYGLLVGVAGACGVLLSGYLTDRLRQRDPRWGLWLICCALIISVPLHLAAWHASSFGVMMIALLIPELFQLYYAPPTFSAIQAVMPARHHAMGSAIFLLFATGVGISLGPFLTGLLSDRLAHLGAGAALGWALSALTLIKIWSAAHFAMAASRLPFDIAEREREVDGS
ncbi:spinster family MFS transporter [Sphingopyxis sp. 113P3]|uniref:spinster family MFS transporter n=1 Tax=Sphingopyxis sp. (strain 113P3) TaxID=292913 RepID=UPI0006AD0B3D|nr:MFS transporter [Sphingopyxis sp. 113P3]ALC14107.1 MFS transporter, ACS family, hexuronate transporter [Sphingopyxis sp. 113P3]